MTTIVVLFNLNPGVSEAEYEAWAKEHDMPTVATLASVSEFRVQKAKGVLGGGTSPYQYAEIVEVKDMDLFLKEVASPQMRVIAGRFQELADHPTFILTEALT